MAIPSRSALRRIQLVLARSSAAQSAYSPDPLPPDANGYCYINRTHFDCALHKVMRRIHPSLVLPLFWIASLTPPAAFAVFVASRRSLLGPALVLGVLVPVFMWLLTRKALLARRIVARRLCFRCGYSLVQSPVSEQGTGTCPECGNTFLLAHYRRPPRRYLRLTSATPSPQVA